MDHGLRRIKARTRVAVAPAKAPGVVGQRVPRTGSRPPGLEELRRAFYQKKEYAEAIH